jgi:hypothetical protein
MNKYTPVMALAIFLCGAVVGHSMTQTTYVVEGARASVNPFELMLMARNLPEQKADAI